ncbi:hypothetical protein VIGAN_03280300, partial [Vigna angularis var. angularis]
TKSNNGPVQAQPGSTTPTQGPLPSSLNLCPSSLATTSKVETIIPKSRTKPILKVNQSLKGKPIYELKKPNSNQHEELKPHIQIQKRKLRLLK